MEGLFGLKNRYFIVTGASGLLGREHCSAILAYSGIPVAIDIDNESLVSLQNDLKKVYGVKIPIFNSSITDIYQLNKVKKEFLYGYMVKRR